jgi:hypothetical protein
LSSSHTSQHAHSFSYVEVLYATQYHSRKATHGLPASTEKGITLVKTIFAATKTTKATVMNLATSGKPASCWNVASRFTGTPKKDSHAVKIYVMVPPHQQNAKATGLLVTARMQAAAGTPALAEMPATAMSPATAGTHATAWMPFTAGTDATSDTSETTE